jgi:hypothetical protein
MTDQPATTFESVRDGIIAEHGGRACFSVAQLAVASALARAIVALADGNTAAASSIPALTAMLPLKLKVEAQATPSILEKYDLTQLSDSSWIRSSPWGSRPSERL